MVVYSFYIFDRHTECIYSKSWLPPPSVSSHDPLTNPPTHPQHQQPPPHQPQQPPQSTTTTTLTLTQKQSSDNAKLLFGTVFSLRNMVRKLGGPDDAFISYRTAQYKLHYYETASSLRFVMLTDVSTLSMRNVLHQIYINLWVEYVVKNPLSPVEHKGGEGVRNELFELGLDQFVRGLM
ncbi:Longin-like domain-containing protein [Cercophora samala]|uniref:Trafficking protein particle complex subunit n=1 Tax=Cercophora samala TaxID=330535 RepID=A0AA40DEL0_9PEZI|nr:Longin-like domain-containing protein [Cercophora samala]